jgi:hypothetical protein
VSQSVLAILLTDVWLFGWLVGWLVGWPTNLNEAGTDRPPLDLLIFVVGTGKEIFCVECRVPSAECRESSVKKECRSS